VKKISITVISIFLALAFVVLTPGMFVGAANTNEIKSETFVDEFTYLDKYDEKKISGVTPLSSSISETIFSDAKRRINSGEITSFEDADKSLVRLTEAHRGEARRALNSRSYSSGYISTKPYLKQEYGYFDSTLSKVAQVSTSSGALNVGYVLGNLSGRGGFGTNLQLIYDSSDSESKDRTWSITHESEYYAVIGDVIYRYDSQSSGGEGADIFFENVTEYTFSTQSELELFLSDKNDMVRPNNVWLEDGYVYELYSDAIIESGIGYLPVGVETDRELTPAQVGLAPGWRFNVPSMELLNSKIDNNDNVNTDSYIILTLDTGESYKLNNLIPENHNIEDITIVADTSIINGKTAAYRVTLKTGVMYYFDEIGCPIRKEDRYGNGINYSFDYTGMLSSISDNSGRAISLSLNSNDISVTNPDGVVNTITLSNTSFYSTRKLVSLTFAGNETYAFSYTENQSSYSYTSTSSLIYSTWALLTGITMPNGDSSSFNYVMRECEWGYGTLEYYVVGSKSDVIGNTTKHSVSYTYTGTSRDANNYRIKYETYSWYPPYTYTVTESFGNGKKVNQYNEKCLLLSFESYIGTTCIESNLYEYDANLMLVKSTKSSLSEYGTEYFEYDSKGNMTASYDRQSSGNTDTLHKTTYTYSSTYSICTSKSYYQNASTKITETNTLSPDNKSVISSTKKVGNVVVSLTDFTYDIYGNVLTKTEYILPGSGTIITSYSYTDNVTRPIGINMDGVYCTAVTVTGVKDADGQTLSDVTTSTTFDLVGRKTSETNALGNTTTYAYNTDGKLSSVTYPDNTTETYTYSAANGTVTHTDVSGLSLMTTYNGLGDVVSVTDVQTSTVLSNTTYDAYSRVYREYTCTAVTPYSYKEYSYDALGRVTSEQVKNNSGTVISKKTYSYSPSEHKITTTSVGDSNAPSIVEVTTYDCMGRTTSSKVGTSETTYTYDYLGNVLTVTDPAGYTTTTVYAPRSAPLPSEMR